MNYTIQLSTESGCFAAPSGTDVRHVRSKADMRWYLEHWSDDVGRYSEGRCSVLIWRGHHKDVTDLYPDAEATLGKRGGMIITNL